MSGPSTIYSYLDNLKMSSSFTCAFFLLGLVPSLYTAAAASIGSGTGLKHEYRITQRDNISGPTVNGPKMGGANFPDPSLIFANGSWYAFATGSGNAHIQVASSTDFNDWNRLQFDAMPDITAAKWATQSVSATRSPDVVQLVIYVVPFCGAEQLIADWN